MFYCTKLRHLIKNCMKTGITEDEKKAKAENIRKKMWQKWVPNSLENGNQDHEVNDTQVNMLGGSNTSTQFLMEITRAMIQKKKSNISTLR